MSLPTDRVLCAPTDDDLPVPMLPGPEGTRAAPLDAGGSDPGRPRLADESSTFVSCTSREAHEALDRPSAAEDAGPFCGPADAGAGIGADPASVIVTGEPGTDDTPPG